MESGHTTGMPDGKVDMEGFICRMISKQTQRLACGIK